VYIDVCVSSFIQTTFKPYNLCKRLPSSPQSHHGWRGAQYQFALLHLMLHHS
jgi:hypothetical protein